LNKVDAINESELRRACERFPQGVPISARNGIGLSRLMDFVVEKLEKTE